MENKQGFNPFLPSYEYIPDAEPRVFGDRLYIYGSHDKFNGISFCVNDYVCWSAPLSNLADWRYEGIIYCKKQDKGFNFGFLNSMFAPDVIQGNDGRYYMYYFVSFKGYISVAVCDTPAGKYEYLGRVKYSDGIALGSKGEPLQFDPGIFIDDDGRIFLYTGFAPQNFSKVLMRNKRPATVGAMVMELEQDMITIKTPFKYICKTKSNGKGTDFEEHEFFEASSLRKFDGKYYFIYSSFHGHELCYAVSDYPDKGFRYGGVLVSIADLYLSDKPINYTGNTHGSLIRINGNYYVFYHRQTNRNSFSRQACAERIEFKDGKFMQAEITSCGLNNGPLKGIGKYEARIACNLYSKEGIYFYGAFKKKKGVHPYFTQYGSDREHSPNQHISNFCDGAVAGFKYFQMEGANYVRIDIKGSAEGCIKVFYDMHEDCVATIKINKSARYTSFGAELKPAFGVEALYFVFNGTGSMEFMSFELIKSN